MDIEEYLLEVQGLIEEPYTDALRMIEADMGWAPGTLSESAMSPGKRLRPMLVLLVNQALGGTVEEAMEYAVAAELVHSGSLPIDDILDQDTNRRGLPSVHTLVGIGGAVLTSIATMSKALDVMSNHGAKAQTIAARCVYAMVKGAAREFKLLQKRFDEGLYVDVVELKTSALFAISAHFGALSANAGNGIEEAARRYGFAFGKAFQLQDDLTDTLWSIKDGEPRGDVKEGKLTLPTNGVFDGIPTAEELSAPPEARVRAGMTMVKTRLESLEAEMIQQLAQFPESEYRAVLKELPGFTLKKMLEERRVWSLWCEATGPSSGP